MKQEELAQMQPQLLERFERILESGHLSHAYLFSGDFGSFDLASLLAQTLFCSEKRGGWACGKCRSCCLIEQEEFSDVTVVRPVNQIIKTDRIRDLVKSFSQSGVEGDRQVFIICQADKMHPNAANSLLKTMEEPQSEIYLFLLTSDSEKVLPTIRSRAQLVTFQKNKTYISQHLEGKGLLKSQADLIADLAATLTEAENLAASSSFEELSKSCQAVVQDFLQGQARVFLQVAKLSVLADDKTKQEQALQILELLLAKDLYNSQAREGLERLLLARQMWRQNVAFQTALEYMMVKEKDRNE